MFSFIIFRMLGWLSDFAGTCLHAAHALHHLPLRRRDTGRTGQGTELEVAGGVAPQGDAVLLFPGASQRRTAPFFGVFMDWNF